MGKDSTALHCRERLISFDKSAVDFLESSLWVHFEFTDSLIAEAVANHILDAQKTMFHSDQNELIAKVETRTLVSIEVQ